MKISEKIKIKGMTCTGCEKTIEKGLTKKEGIIKVKTDFKTGEASITYDNEIISKSDIGKTLNDLGYEISDKKTDKISLIILAIIIFLILNQTNIFNVAPKIDETISYGMLFIIGLLTSMHCIFMCGGINIAATSKRGYKGGIHYNLGRLTSYTIIGGFVGMLGGVIAFNQAMKDAINIIVGILMILMALQMLRIINLPKIKMIKIKSTSKSPFIIGLLNGFMPCGPLQSMQIYALSTGSFISGAISMFLFAAGTIPLMLSFSFLNSFLSSKKSRMLKNISSFFILVFGLLILSRSFSLKDLIPEKKLNIPYSAVYAIDKGYYQEVTVRFERGMYKPIVVQKGKKVIWNIMIEGGDLNGCNDEIYIPEYDLSKKLSYGKNVVEFTPEKSGVFKYTCWMNMLRSQIYVVDQFENKVE